MKLTLEREDLKPEFVDIACGATKFKHFAARPQRAIRAVGNAMFTTNGGTNHNVIYPPALCPKPKAKKQK